MIFNDIICYMDTFLSMVSPFQWAIIQLQRAVKVNIGFMGVAWKNAESFVTIFRPWDVPRML